MPRYSAGDRTSAGSTTLPIWTFGDDGLAVTAADAVEAVTNGIGVLVENGTGQVCQAYIVWDE
jgi:hypothetical protein